jgi:putative ABC transport system ATP-binding protein
MKGGCKKIYLCLLCRELNDPFDKDNPREHTYPMSILEARQLTKNYTVDNRHIKVLDDISLEVAAGEFLVITGASGSGKTTLLTLLSGLDHPSSGKVLIDSKDITGATEDELAPMRNKIIGFVFQSFHLVPSMTARENIMFPAELLGDDRASEKADRLLERMGLSDRGDNLPSQLSGGEKQRVALCRSMINQPKLLFADEPTGNLDSKSGMAVLSQLVDLKNEQGATLILVTHNPDIAKAADRLLVIKDGRLADSVS